MIGTGMRGCVALIIVLAAGAVGAAGAQDGWLDDPLVPWNAPGMAIPVPPPDVQGPVDPICMRSVRSAETPEDEAVVGHGWMLFGTYEGGWGLRVLGATAGFDGMCRPVGYQYFVFWEGQFAGTLSPVPMVSRTTGAGRILSIDSERRIVASFPRYAETDPLCCPSRPALALEFRVQITDRGPTLVPERVFEFN